jgi:hypothetical protein
MVKRLTLTQPAEGGGASGTRGSTGSAGAATCSMFSGFSLCRGRTEQLTHL